MQLYERKDFSRLNQKALLLRVVAVATNSITHPFGRAAIITFNVTDFAAPLQPRELQHTQLDHLYIFKFRHRNLWHGGGNHEHIDNFTPGSFGLKLIWQSMAGRYGRSTHRSFDVLARMDTDRIVTEIEQPERMFSAPDTRPLKRKRSCGRELWRRFPEMPEASRISLGPAMI